MTRPKIMKVILVCATTSAALLYMLTLQGCGANPNIVSNLVKLPTGQIVSAATNRFGSYERVRAMEEKTKQQIAKTEAAKAKAEEARYRENIKVTITTSKQLADYALMRANDALARANDTLGRALIAITSGKSIYDLPSTPFPEGAFTAAFRTIFHGAAEVLDTPTSMFVGGGWALDRILSGANAGAGNQFNLKDGDINASKSFNNSVMHQTNSSGAVMQPEVVRPEVVVTPPQVTSTTITREKIK